MSPWRDSSPQVHHAETSLTIWARSPSNEGTGMGPSNSGHRRYWRVSGRSAFHAARRDMAATGWWLDFQRDKHRLPGESQGCTGLITARPSSKAMSQSLWSAQTNWSMAAGC